MKSRFNVWGTFLFDFKLPHRAVVTNAAGVAAVARQADCSAAKSANLAPKGPKNEGEYDGNIDAVFLGFPFDHGNEPTLTPSIPASPSLPIQTPPSR
jgi:hypothetical protein